MMMMIIIIIIMANKVNTKLNNRKDDTDRCGNTTEKECEAKGIRKESKHNS